MNIFKSLKDIYISPIYDCYLIRADIKMRALIKFW